MVAEFPVTIAGTNHVIAPTVKALKGIERATGIPMGLLPGVIPDFSLSLFTTVLYQALLAQGIHAYTEDQISEALLEDYHAPEQPVCATVIRFVAEMLPKHRLQARPGKKPVRPAKRKTG